MPIDRNMYRAIAGSFGMACVCLITASLCGCTNHVQVNNSAPAPAAMTCMHSYNVDERSSILSIRNEGGQTLSVCFIVFWRKALDNSVPDRNVGERMMGIGSEFTGDPVLLFLGKRKFNSVTIDPSRGDQYERIWIAPKAACSLIIHDDPQEQFPKSNSIELYAKVSALCASIEKGEFHGGQESILEVKTDPIVIKLPPKTPAPTGLSGDPKPQEGK